jgi:hypothetical protein
MNFDNILFRASSSSKLITEPKSKAAKEAGDLSESTKTHLIDVYVSEKYSRKTDISNKYVEKGNSCEEDSITLASRLTKTFYKKNEEQLSNQFIKGTPDLFEGESIHNATTIIDIKTSWDAFTFFRNHTKELDSDYYWQVQCYMALTGAQHAKVIFCLVNTPANLIIDEKRKLGWKMGVIFGGEEPQEYREACMQIEVNMIYDLQMFHAAYPSFEFHNEITYIQGVPFWPYDIPMAERKIEFSVEKNIDDLMKLYSKIIKCREFLNELENKLNPSIQLTTNDTET